MGAEENELTDVTLCYQALGIPLSASPVQIEQRYRTLSDEYKKKMSSQDPADLEEARRNLELLAEMYQKIRGSITYKAMEREHQKNEPAPAKRVHDVVAQRGLMMQCPRCNGVFVKGTEVCPICKTQVHSPLQKLASSWLSPKVAIAVAIVVAGAIAAIVLTR